MNRVGRVILKHDISIVENSPGYDYVYVINPLGTVKQNVSPGDLLLNYLVPGGYTVHFYIVPFYLVDNRAGIHFGGILFS